MTASRQAPLDRATASRLLEEADALGIPWERILEEEVRAEKTLRRFLRDSDPEPPLAALLVLLPDVPLASWRVRDRVAKLSWEARAGENGDGARQELRRLDAHLRRRADSDPAVAAALESHLLFAWGRIRELLAISRSAFKARGAESDRIARVRARTSCTADDALWAVRNACAGRGRRLEEVLGRVREEGFAVPPGPTEKETFRSLRAFLRRRGLLAPMPRPTPETPAASTAPKPDPAR
ncbi:MAG TPA: hypothetical protein VEG84_07875 [Thermoanaerobaculia bacterium]|nr:hypothetical protein [Thermoanaerobaculia bacterium]